jgi:hypothetical protein
MIFYLYSKSVLIDSLHDVLLRDDDAPLLSELHSQLLDLVTAHYSADLVVNGPLVCLLLHHKYDSPNRCLLGSDLPNLKFLALQHSIKLKEHILHLVLLAVHGFARFEHQGAGCESDERYTRSQNHEGYNK